MPYNTGNPIPSSDAKDLSDNAENLDNSVNTALDTWTDRLGVERRTIQGQLKLLGYTAPDVYAGGLVFTVADNMATIERNKIIYAPLPSALPFTTSGTWTADDENKFFVVQGLFAGDPSLISRIQFTIDILSDTTSPQVFESDYYDSNKIDRSGAKWIATGNTGAPGTTDFDNGLIYNGSGNEYKFNSAALPNIGQFGAVADGATDVQAAAQSMINYAATMVIRGRAVVTIPANSQRWQCNSNLTIPTNVEVWGPGNIRFGPSSAFLCYGDFWAIKHMTIESAQVAGTYAVVIAQGAQSFSIEDVKFRDFEFGIYATNCFTFALNKNEFINENFRGKFAILMTNGVGTDSLGNAYGAVNNGKLDDNHVAQIGFESGGGFEVGIQVGDNISHPTLTSSHCRQIKITNGGMEGCDAGIRAAESIAVSIEGVYFEACANGVFFTGDYMRSPEVSNCIFAGRVGQSDFNAAIEIAFGGTGLPFSTAALIENNVFDECEFSVTTNFLTRALTLIGNETNSPHNASFYNIDPQTNVTKINDGQEGTKLFSINPSDPPSGNFNIEAFMSGSVFHNRDFTANQFWELPPATAGLEYHFANTNANAAGGSGFDMTVRVDGSDTIDTEAGSFTTAVLNNRGNSLFLKCVEPGIWTVLAEKDASYL